MKAPDNARGYSESQQARRTRQRHGRGDFRLDFSPEDRGPSRGNPSPGKRARDFLRDCMSAWCGLARADVTVLLQPIPHVRMHRMCNKPLDGRPESRYTSLRRDEARRADRGECVVVPVRSVGSHAGSFRLTVGGEESVSAPSRSGCRSRPVMARFGANADMLPDPVQGRRERVRREIRAHV